MTPLLVVCLVGVAPGDREAVRDALVIEGWKGDREPSASFVSGLEACPPATAVSVSVAPESARVRAGDATNEVTLAGLGEADRAVEIARAAMASVAPSSDPLAGLGEVAVAPTAPSPRALAGPTLVAGPTLRRLLRRLALLCRLAAGPSSSRGPRRAMLTRATLGKPAAARAGAVARRRAGLGPAFHAAPSSRPSEIGGYAMLDLALRLAARPQLGLGVGAGALYRHTRIDGVGARRGGRRWRRRARAARRPPRHAVSARRRPAHRGLQRRPRLLRAARRRAAARPRRRARPSARRRQGRMVTLLDVPLLVRRRQAGDDAAWHELHRAHAPIVARFVTRMIGPSATAASTTWCSRSSSRSCARSRAGAARAASAPGALRHRARRRARAPSDDGAEARRRLGRARARGGAGAEPDGVVWARRTLTLVEVAVFALGEAHRAVWVMRELEASAARKWPRRWASACRRCGRAFFKARRFRVLRGAGGGRGRDGGERRRGPGARRSR
ncbi:MAG: hypothetical protein U1F43_02145 [Myxococcota bacterium]